MRRFLFPAVMILFLAQSCSSPAASRTTPTPGWSLYSNAAFGYEIQFPGGFDLWPTGPEGEREGASIRIAIQDRQALFPILDITVSPRAPEPGFSKPGATSPDLTADAADVVVGSLPAREQTLRWKTNNEVAFVEIFLEGVVFRFTAEPGMTDFHSSEWWDIISTFRFTKH
jgi:hypothetical protein